jgi:environmental stress-induced protein Ves
MTGRILRTNDYQRMPWKNGGGTTTEIWKQTAPSGETLWRLSIADVASEGPFSEFPGIDRWIMVIEGAGMQLTIDGLGTKRLDRPFEPLFFPGDAKTDCKLIDGPIRDFNFMIARSFGQGTLQVSRLAAGMAAPLAENTAAIHVLAGSAEIAINDIRPLAAGDTWIASTPSPKLGEVREGEAAPQRETVIARFPHPNRPPNWGRGNDTRSSIKVTGEAMLAIVSIATAARA